jgi:hypothetical protein
MLETTGLGASRVQWTRMSDRKRQIEVSAIRSFMEEFYIVAEAYVEVSNPATTFASCAAGLDTREYQW